jgi:hypothetical protein
MQWRQAAAALVLVGASAIGVQAHAAPVSPALSHMDLIAHGDPAIRKIYWMWRSGARVWVGPPPRYPHGWGPQPYYGRAPYWHGGRGYWHRRWHRDGWRHW